MMKAIATVSLLFFTAIPAFADFNSGLWAYQKKDYETAEREFRPLAEQGNTSAQYYLGKMYYNGLGLPMNNTKAVKWFKLAAEQGYALAQYRLGLVYVYHWREDEGVQWIRKAAEQGYVLAQDNLALMYFLGHGVAQDYVRARMWWIIAASHGLKVAPKKRDQTTQFMTPSEITEAQQLAGEWMAKSGK